MDKIFRKLRKSSAVSPLVSDGPVRFGLPFLRSNDNFAREHKAAISVNNYGGPGRGIFVIAEGEIGQRSDIRIDGLGLWSPGQRKSFPFEPMTAEFLPFENDGHTFWRADFPDFVIPEGVNLEYRHQTTAKRMRHDFQYSVVFNFIVHADAPVEELVLRIVPMENPSGEYIYRQSECNFSSSDTEDMKNGIISPNELIKRKRTFD